MKRTSQKTPPLLAEPGFLLRMQPMSITLTAAVGTSAHGTGDVVITSPGLGTTTRVRG
jgi:hypothetical protein